MQTARQILENSSHNCVLTKNDDTVFSDERGVKPLIGFIESEKNYSGYDAADKIVGKAAAFLYILMGVKSIYAPVMSEAAIHILNKYSVENSCGVTVRNIINRKGDGMCPMEMTVKEINDPATALTAIKKKLAELSSAPRK